MDHVSPAESHDCVKTIYVKFVKKNALRRHSNINSALNITGGIFKVVCGCGYTSRGSPIEIAGVNREEHMKNCHNAETWIESVE